MSYKLQIKAGDFRLVENYGYESIEFDIDRYVEPESLEELDRYLEEWKEVTADESPSSLKGYMVFLKPGETRKNCPRELKEETIKSGYNMETIAYHAIIDKPNKALFIESVAEYINDVCSKKTSQVIPQSEVNQVVNHLEQLFESLADWVGVSMEDAGMYEKAGASPIIKKIGEIAKEFSFSTTIPDSVIEVFKKNAQLYGHRFDYWKWHEVGNHYSSETISVSGELLDMNPKLYSILE